MTQKRLNHLSIINCHNEELDILDMGKVGNEFVKKTTIRSNTFDIKIVNLLVNKKYHTFSYSSRNDFS